MSIKNTQSLKFNSFKQGKDTKLKTNFDFYETTVKRDNSEVERVILICHKVWIKDKNGVIRQTPQGDYYKANIIDGVLSFDKPLKFENNER
ncbi:hypothetical protein MC378_07365 [Polaribacter sp. MSW13]|uniref:Uncharacterized protein n=1 Tax=Polaribacter marinus TaxID=2916838 RepID=A0A9X1VMR2_9FLAO|nr:hypothetical protein [Polaribacter marinus]MCI2228981.1 hypothetical protein [Polaribacter marinus]